MLGWAGLGCAGRGGALVFRLFSFFKQSHPAATSPIHSCGMERCFKDKYSMVNALTARDLQILEPGM